MGNNAGSFCSRAVSSEVKPKGGERQKQGIKRGKWQKWQKEKGDKGVT